MRFLTNGSIRAALLVVAFVAGGCAPSPKNTPCSNGGECGRVDARFHYCVQHRCVECIEDASCGERGVCVDGACERR